MILTSLSREYVKITVDYPLAAAKAFSGLSDSFNFVYVSGEGVCPTYRTTSSFIFGQLTRTGNTRTGKVHPILRSDQRRVWGCLDRTVEKVPQSEALLRQTCVRGRGIWPPDTGIRHATAGLHCRQKAALWDFRSRNKTVIFQRCLTDEGPRTFPDRPGQGKRTTTYRRRGQW